ncbi:RelA/SpoT family protein [Candidatus Gracilibacteria bacterium]|nr:RelA/SpoT family protein [Candidatus Gracilibacteria bacterium]
MDYSKIDKRVKEIVKKASLYMVDKPYEEINEQIFKAYDYARDAHEGQTRLSGDPYLLHPVESTLVLLDLKPDIPTIQACLLHDVVEDTPRTIDEIRVIFGNEIAFLCEGMEKVSKIRYVGEERNIGSLRKMFIAMAQDLRVIFIKLSDRLHNMRTLKHHPKKDKQTRIALETLNIYAPIADRLGLFSLKNELEEECFKILEPTEYKRIKKQMIEFKSNISHFQKNSKKEIEKVLIGIIEDYQVTYRVKSVFSIYKKMKKKGFDHIDSMYDLFGVKVLVPDIPTCYKVLGIIHNQRTPIPNRFKDYIALPKPNGYRSLHTTIMGFLTEFRQQPTEIQIKTYEMNEYADIGVAAHFEYKEKGSQVAHDIDWVKELKELTENLGNNDFISSLKIDVFRDRIFVFTPKGLSVNLPAGSTSIDYAYAIHSEVGNHTVISKVNGKIYPLDKELSNGDVVQIITDNSKKPSPFWLSFVKTTRAKERIRSFLKKENKDINVERGKDILNKYLEKVSLPILDKDLLVLRVIDDREHNLEERISILEQVGNFSVNPSSIIRKIMKSKNMIAKKEVKDGVKHIIENSTEAKKEEIIIGGERGIDYKVCKKCISGGKVPNKIVGHINSKGIITIHNRNCPILLDVNKDRLLPAHRKGEEDDYIIVSLGLIFLDKIGVLKDLSEIIFSMGINIEEINSKKLEFNKHEIKLKLEIPDYDYLIVDRLVERVRLKFGQNLVSFFVDKILMQ